jgi:protoporphyrinogen oxidase
MAIHWRINPNGLFSGQKASMFDDSNHSNANSGWLKCVNPNIFMIETGFKSFKSFKSQIFDLLRSQTNSVFSPSQIATLRLFEVREAYTAFTTEAHLGFFSHRLPVTMRRPLEV